MNAFLEFLMSAEELTRLEALSNTPWTSCNVPGGISAIDGNGVWYHAPRFVIQNIHGIEAAWHEFDSYEGISRIAINEEVDFQKPESPTYPTTSAIHLSEKQIFTNMDNAEDFLIKKKECFVINKEIDLNIAIDTSEEKIKAYADAGILFKERKRQLLFLVDEMPMWVRITSHCPTIEKILSSSHRLRML